MRGARFPGEDAAAAGPAAAPIKADLKTRQPRMECPHPMAPLLVIGATSLAMSGARTPTGVVAVQGEAVADIRRENNTGPCV